MIAKLMLIHEIKYFHYELNFNDPPPPKKEKRFNKVLII